MEHDRDLFEIRLTKGDTPTIPFFCGIEDEYGGVHAYEPVEHDVFIFAVKRRPMDVEPLFYRELDKETMTVTLKEEDTKDLRIGNYIYEVSLNNGDFHYTFIKAKPFVLTTEIY